jgi:hypothetical protein
LWRTPETFYKTEVTEEKFAESAEYYTLALIHRTGSFFIVTEHHGWWDNVATNTRDDSLAVHDWLCLLSGSVDQTPRTLSVLHQEVG